MHEAQAMYADADVPISSSAGLERRTRQLAEAFIDLYDAWHTAEPGEGYDAQAAEWRAKLPDTEPNSASP